MPDNGRHEAELNRFWNELVHSDAEPDSGGLDARDAETLRRIHAMTRTPPPAGARSRVDGAMRKQIAAHQNGKDVSDMTHSDLFMVRRPGIAAPWPPTRSAAAPTARPNTSGWQWLGQFATAILLLVTIALGYLVFGPGRPYREPTPGAPLIAPPATASPSAGSEDELVSVNLPAGALPAETIGGFNYYTVPAGSDGTWDWTCCEGVRLDYVLDGALTIRGAGPMQVRRGGGANWDEIAPGTEFVVEAGDALLSRMEDTFDSVNAGTSEVALLDGVLFAGTPVDDPVPYQQSGVAQWEYHDQDLFFDPVDASGPVALRLRQTVLAAGDVLPAPSDGSVQLVVDLDENAVVTTGADFSRRNLSDGSVTVYALTVESGAVAEGTPAAETVAATMLANIVLPAGDIPSEVIGGLSYWTIPVDTRSSWEPARTGNTCCTGPRLDYVVAGDYSVRAAASVQVLRARSDTWEEIAAGTEVALTPGDAILSPMGAVFEAANVGSTPVELVEGVLFAGETAIDPVPSGWTYNGGNSQDIFLEPRSMPDAPLRIQLREAILAPGAVTSVPDGVLTQLVVTPDRYANLAIKPNPDSSKATDAAARYVKRNIGSTPLIVYVLTVEPDRAP